MLRLLPPGTTDDGVQSLLDAPVSPLFSVRRQSSDLGVETDLRKNPPFVAARTNVCSVHRNFELIKIPEFYQVNHQKLSPT